MTGAVPIRTSKKRTAAQRRRTERLIALAVELIEDERVTVVDAHTNRSGEHKGKITDQDAQRWIRNYDRFLKPARAYLKRRGIVARGLLRE